MDNFRLSSAMSINGSIRMAGTIISKEECKNFSEEVLDSLLEDDHLIPTSEPVTAISNKRVGINRLLPRNRRASSTGTNSPATEQDGSSKE